MLYKILTNQNTPTFDSTEIFYSRITLYRNTFPDLRLTKQG